MTKSRETGIGPSLLLAFGVIGSTIVAVQLSHSWFALVGPAIMAITLIGASALIPLSADVRRKAIQRAIILGTSLLIASVIVVMKDPALLAPIMPILAGATAATVVIKIPCRVDLKSNTKENIGV